MIQEGNDPIAKLHTMFFDASDANLDERREAEKARDYYDGKQYTSEELQVLAERRQPPTTLNRVARKINHLAGVEVDRRSDPKALARTEKHEKGAEAATDALRYVEETKKLDAKFTDVHSNMLVEGYGAIELTVKEVSKRDNAEHDIDAVAWKWDTLFYDPQSTMHDFSDATYLGGVIWLDAEKAKLRWPDKAAELMRNGGSSDGSAIDEYEDKPEKKAWITKGKRQRIRIIHMYYMSKGKWWLCQFTGGGVLANKEVPFVDEDGENFCPMFFQSAYVDRDGDRYGEVRNLLSPQDMINKAHSKLQHLTQTRQIIADEDAFNEKEGGIERARQELAKPDGVIIKNAHASFEIQSTADMVQGHASLLQEYKQEIDLMGPNASMQGKGPSSQSGRALLAQTEGGMREFTPLSDRYVSFKERVYKAIWLLIRAYWTQEKWIRVTDDNYGTKFVGLNIPVTRMQKAEERMREQGYTEDDIYGVKSLVEQNPINSYAANQVVEIKNNVEEIDVDITISSGPDLVSVQSEQFSELARLAPAMAQAGKPIPIDILIKASSLRDKQEIIDQINGDTQNPQEAARQQEIQQQQIRLQVEKAMAEIEKDKASAEKDLSRAARDDAETLRILNQPQELRA